eukprot:2381437-Rhodomonas_salina.1
MSCLFGSACALIRSLSRSLSFFRTALISGVVLPPHDQKLAQICLLPLTALLKAGVIHTPGC